MKYSPALIDAYLMLGESVIWSQPGHFTSTHVLSGRRLRRNGLLMATTHRLLFIQIARKSVQLESINYHWISGLELRQSLLKGLLSFQVSGNACLLRSKYDENLKMNLHWLRQRVNEEHLRRQMPAQA